MKRCDAGWSSGAVTFRCVCCLGGSRSAATCQSCFYLLIKPLVCVASRRRHDFTQPLPVQSFPLSCFDYTYYCRYPLWTGFLPFGIGLSLQSFYPAVLPFRPVGLYLLTLVGLVLFVSAKLLWMFLCCNCFMSVFRLNSFLIDVCQLIVGGNMVAVCEHSMKYVCLWLVVAVVWGALWGDGVGWGRRLAACCRSGCPWRALRAAWKKATTDCNRHRPNNYITLKSMSSMKKEDSVCVSPASIPVAAHAANRVYTSINNLFTYH